MKNVIVIIFMLLSLTISAQNSVTEINQSVFPEATFVQKVEIDVECPEEIEIVIKEAEPYDLKKHTDYKAKITKNKIVLYKKGKKITILHDNKVTIEPENPVYFIELSNGVELLCSIDQVEAIVIERTPNYGDIYMLFKKM